MINVLYSFERGSELEYKRSVRQQLGFLTDHPILVPASQGERRQEKG